MEHFRKFLAARLAGQQKEADTHPSADLLSAFAEVRLRNGERKRVLTHLAVCRECRDVLAFTASDRVPTAAEKETRVRWWNVRWAAALATACVVGVVIWHADSLSNVAQRRAAPVQSAGTAPKREAPPDKAQPPKSRQASPRQKVQPPPGMRPAIHSSVTPQAAATVPEPPAPPAPSVDEIAKASQDMTLPATEPLDPGSLKAFGTAPQSTLHARPMAFQNLLRPQPMKASAQAPRRQTLWSIASTNGQLQRSSDGGQTWSAIPVAGQTAFLALSVSGSDIWAGGEAGALFHSTDDGFQWKEVPLTDGAERLKESIIGIETQGSQVTVRTKSAKWISTDNGVSWRKMGE
jgi:hypothetical protein